MPPCYTGHKHRGTRSIGLWVCVQVWGFQGGHSGGKQDPVMGNCHPVIRDSEHRDTSRFVGVGKGVGGGEGGLKGYAEGMRP
jgi:hypothetical protein